MQTEHEEMPPAPKKADATPATCAVTFKRRGKPPTWSIPRPPRHCGRHFGNMQAVRKHELIHEEPQLKCGHCDKICSR